MAELQDTPNYVSSTERVLVRLEGSALHITFNNPAKHNALSVDMWGAQPPLLAQAANDERVRMVVFSGAGDKAFVSGADISQFEDQRAAREAVAHYEQLAESALMAIHHFKKPTLACIRGWCIGGGVGAAKHLVFTARRIDAAEAHRLGLVSRVAPVEARRAFMEKRKPRFVGC